MQDIVLQCTWLRAGHFAQAQAWERVRTQQICEIEKAFLQHKGGKQKALAKTRLLNASNKGHRY